MSQRRALLLAAIDCTVQINPEPRIIPILSTRARSRRQNLVDAKLHSANGRSNQRTTTLHRESRTLRVLFSAKRISWTIRSSTSFQQSIEHQREGKIKECTEDKSDTSYSTIRCDA